MSNTPIPERSISLPSLIWLHSRFLPHRHRFNQRNFHAVFVVEKVTYRQNVL